MNGTDQNEHFLTPEDQRICLTIAHHAIDCWVRVRERTDWEAFDTSDRVRRVGGSFVTVRTHGQLRGCIGSIVHTDPLAQSVRDNAIGAASRDPRFAPVQPSELDAIQIEISALTEGDRPGTPFRRVYEIEEIQVGRDGICIEVDGKRGLLLPQVAVERDWNREQFLTATCIKAGAPERAWQSTHAVISRFSAQVFGD